jgi:hypothetical protein
MVTEQHTVNGGKTARLTAACPAGEHVLGGGFHNSSALEVGTAHSYPSEGPSAFQEGNYTEPTEGATAWTIIVFASHTHFVKVYALCATIG